MRYLTLCKVSHFLGIVMKKFLLIKSFLLFSFFVCASDDMDYALSQTFYDEYFVQINDLRPRVVALREEPKKARALQTWAELRAGCVTLRSPYVIHKSKRYPCELKRLVQQRDTQQLKQKLWIRRFRSFKNTL